MSRKRLAASVAGVVIVLALIARVAMAASGSGAASGVPVDAAHASARPAVSPAASPSPTQATPRSPLELIRRASTPGATQAQLAGASGGAKPLLVLNPRTGRSGDSIGVWGSGFPGGATVDIYVKQDMSETVDPVTFAQADQSGHFGRVSVTVPDSVPRGSLVIVASERQGSATAMAAATVLDGPDNTLVQVQATATPTAAEEANPTAVPKGTAQAQPSPTSSATPKPTEQAKSTKQAKPTEQPKSTEQPKESQQPKSNEQPKPTEQPKATEQPKQSEQQQPVADTPRSSPSNPNPNPNPNSNPNPNPNPNPSGYTIQAGDSLAAIAQQVYGNSNDWHTLYEANRDTLGDNPNLIHPGTELVIPPKD